MDRGPRRSNVVVWPPVNFVDVNEVDLLAGSRRQHDHVVPLLELRCRGEGPVGQRVDAGSPGKCVYQPAGRTNGEHGRRRDGSEALR